MHISVLLQESIDNLNLKEDSIIVDATLGRAGFKKRPHTRKFTSLVNGLKF